MCVCVPVLVSRQLIEIWRKGDCHGSALLEEKMLSGNVQRENVHSTLNIYIQKEVADTNGYSHLPLM